MTPITHEPRQSDTQKVFVLGELLKEAINLLTECVVDDPAHAEDNYYLDLQKRIEAFIERTKVI